MREPSAEIAIGFKGVGKTYTTKKIVEDYVMSDASTGRKGRPVLVFDVNGEYDTYQAIDFNIEEPNEFKRAEEIRKIKNAGRYRIVSYKKNRSLMSTTEMYSTVITICRYYRNGLLILEDINKYMLSNVKIDIVGMLIGLRHLGTDLIIHYQSLRAIPPRMWANMNYLRWHKQSDGIDKYRNRLDNYELFKIGERIIEKKYLEDPRYYFWIDKMGEKLINVSEIDFERAALEYLSINPGALKERERLTRMTNGKNSDAVKLFIDEKKKQYLF
jgi:hypothetical protein